MIKITHQGHACFIIENDSEKLIIDQYDNSVGYEVNDEIVNYSLISHNHYDHNYTDNLTIIENAGTMKISKVDSFHDKENGKLRGGNIIHVIETDEVKICHLGDLGHLLSPDQINKIGNIDVLLIPVGGTYTIDYNEAYEVIKSLKPNVVIPMHYKTDKCNINIDYVDKFLEVIKNDYAIKKLSSNTYTFSSNDKNTVIVI